jgi:hypothetical protein
LTFAPILGVINPKLGELVLCTDVNDLAVSVVLMQERQVIAYEFRKLTPTKLKYPNHKKELLIIIHVLKYWNHYFSIT